MILRKINAVLSLIVTVLLLDHAIMNAVWMLSFGSIAKTIGFMPWLMTALIALHAFISIDIAIYGIVSGNSFKYKKYARLNLPTVLQRVSGILLIVFSVLHIAGAMGAITPPAAVHAVLVPLFFTVALIHIAVSGSKAFITLGIGNARAIKVIDIVIKVISGATLIADVTGFYLYLV